MTARATAPNVRKMPPSPFAPSTMPRMISNWAAPEEICVAGTSVWRTDIIA